MQIFTHMPVVATRDPRDAIRGTDNLLSNTLYGDACASKAPQLQAYLCN